MNNLMLYLVIMQHHQLKKSKFSHLEAHDDDLDEKDEVNVYSTQLNSFNLADSEINIVSKFWKSNEKKLPKLFGLAISKLHTPACCCDREKSINLKHSIIHLILFTFFNNKYVLCVCLVTVMMSTTEIKNLEKVKRYNKR